MSSQEAPGPNSAGQPTEKKASQTSGTKLEYPPLEPGSKQIGLLHAEAGTSEPAECTLHICDLANEPHYETISYVWGSPDDRDLVQINGHDVSVPASSARAIRRVRLPEKKSRVIWIDAICIDQSNIDERSQQVAIMGDIYKAGLKNLIYLGNENFDAAIASVRALREDAYEQNANFLLMTFHQVPGYVHYETSRSNPIRVQYNHEALAGLHKNAWFSRVWTYQEPILARENVCLCGKAEVPLLAITGIASWLRYNSSFIEGFIYGAILNVWNFDWAINPAYGLDFYKASWRVKGIFDSRPNLKF